MQPLNGLGVKYIEKGVTNVHNRNCDHHIPAPRPCGRGYARIEHQLGRVKQYGCREKNMTCDAFLS